MELPEHQSTQETSNVVQALVANMEKNTQSLEQMLNKALQRQITCEEAQAAMTEIDLIFDDDLAQYVHLKLTVCSRYAFDLKRARLG